MKLTTAQVEHTLTQLDAKAIPESHPALPQLSGIFGDHTFFIDGNGLNIVEPIPDHEREGRVVSLAHWVDPQLTSLAPHEPRPTDAVVVLEPAP
jgi:hypothetical protein